jgi:NADH:ubiquinone oxidoreductase subunit 4 (subunit M)
MDTNQLVLLLILFSPLIAAVLVLIIGQLGDGAAKWSALILSLVPLALTIYLWVAYQSAPTSPDGQICVSHRGSTATSPSASMVSAWR